VYELISWTTDYFQNEDYFLEASYQIALEVINEQGANTKEEKEFRRVMLPDKTSPTGSKAWNSGGPGGQKVPTELRALTTSLEKRWITTLIEDLRVKLALDLEPIPSLERGMGLQSRPRRKVDFLVIGSSNAGRLTKALNNANYTVTSILNGNWRVSRESCNSLADSIRRAIEQDDPVAVVLFTLDGSTFFAKKEDGSRMLPRKGDDGVYHVEGDLVVASPDTQSEHLDLMKPVFDAIGRKPGLVISPMPRYIIDGCCQNQEHVANRTSRNFRSDMQRQLDGYTKKIKNILFVQNRRNLRVMDSSYDSRHMAEGDVWFCDPVHPLDGIYRKIAAGVAKMAGTLREQDEKQQQKRRRDDSRDNQQPERKPREASYSRFGRDDQRGGYRGGREGRGGRGGRYQGEHGGHRY
jgi:hypothetical protein